MQDLSLLKKYKSQFIALCFVLGALLIIFQVIIPNFQTVMVQQDKNKDEEKKLGDINLSAQLIQSSNEELLKDNLSIAVKALPATKDVAGIYSALADAAASSGVFFEGFTVSPGGIYGESEEEVQGVPSVAVSARISKASSQTLIAFLDTLSRNAPLSEVKDIELSNEAANIELIFFYKPYNLSIINGDVINRLTSAEEDILRTLRESN